MPTDYAQPPHVRGYRPRRRHAAPPPPRRRRRRPLRWGRVALALAVVLGGPLLLGIHAARGQQRSALLGPTGQILAAQPGIPAATRIHATVYNGTAHAGLDAAVAEQLKGLGVEATPGRVESGLTAESYLFHVDHPDAAAAVGAALGLTAPLQPMVADYPPQLDPTTSSRGRETTAEVVVIIGDDYLPPG